jgi:hypothetical protein
MKLAKGIEWSRTVPSVLLRSHIAEEHSRNLEMHCNKSANVFSRKRRVHLSKLFIIETHCSTRNYSITAWG